MYILHDAVYNFRCTSQQNDCFECTNNTIVYTGSVYRHAMHNSRYNSRYNSRFNSRCPYHLYGHPVFYAVHNILYIVYTVYSVHCIVYSLCMGYKVSSGYIVHEFIIQRTLYTGDCIPYTVHCILCTVYIIHCTLYQDIFA